MNRNKKGFTIIEVVLVLAIGGLIFLMVFVALPALQRSQRNTQRREDVDRVAAAIIDYQKHNSGKLPFHECGGYDKNFVPRYIDSSCVFQKQFSGSQDGYTTNTLGQLYYDCTNNFTDPDGTTYVLGISHGASQGSDRPYWTTSGEHTHTILVASNTACGELENSIVYKEGRNNFIVAYWLECGSLYCVDNS